MQKGKIARRARNPVGPTRRQVQQAKELFADFRGDNPQELMEIKLPVPKAGLVIGELDGVLYTTVRDGEKEKYIHEFKKSSRPLLVSSNDGSSLHIIGGKYGMTKRGIVDDD